MLPWIEILNLRIENSNIQTFCAKLRIPREITPKSSSSFDCSRKVVASGSQVMRNIARRAREDKYLSESETQIAICLTIIHCIREWRHPIAWLNAGTGRLKESGEAVGVIIEQNPTWCAWWTKENASDSKTFQKVMNLGSQFQMLLTIAPFEILSIEGLKFQFESVLRVF